MATARKHPQPTWADGHLDDLPAVAALASLAFEPGWRECWSERQMADVLTMPGSWLDLARDDQGHAIAFALSRQVAGEVELLLCGVDPRWQRLGLGRALVQRVRDIAQRRGADRLFLEVRQGNIAARRLYGSAGLGEVGRRGGYYKHVSGCTDDAITLSFSLGR
ncbi:MAG: GNAT family N-acetyltransferase [Thermaurantiacus sp.]